MNTKREYAAIDIFRLAAAFMIVAIHTGPLENISKTADFLVTYCIGRIAVPFFLMVTGYFVLSGFNRKKIEKYLLRTLIMYVGVTLLYLPFTIYAGNLPKGVGGWLKWFLMDGSFYHLWYLPAALLGCVITALLLKFCPLPVSGCAVALLYVTGLLGDSCYGLVSELEPLKSIYDALFAMSAYTRNGIFYAPAFLWIGALLRGREKQGGLSAGETGCRTKAKMLGQTPAETGYRTKTVWILFAVFLLMMLGEGYFTWSMGMQRHNSMYLMLLPVSGLLLAGLLGAGGRVNAVTAMARPVSMWIYLLHPLCIIGIRGVAKVIKGQKILVDNQLVFYILVCITSFIAGIAIELMREVLKRKSGSRAGNAGEDLKEELREFAGQKPGEAEDGRYMACKEDCDVSQGKSVDRTE